MVGIIEWPSNNNEEKTMYGYIHIGFTPNGNAWNVYLNTDREIQGYEKEKLRADRAKLIKRWEGNTFHVDSMTTEPIWEMTVRPEHTTGYHRENGISVPQPLDRDEMIERLKTDRANEKQRHLDGCRFKKVTAGWAYTQLTSAMTNPDDTKCMVQFLGFTVETKERWNGEEYLPQLEGVRHNVSQDREKIAIAREKIANGHNKEFWWSEVYRALRPVCELLTLDLEIDESIYRNSTGHIIRD